MALEQPAVAKRRFGSLSVKMRPPQLGEDFRNLPTEVKKRSDARPSRRIMRVSRTAVSSGVTLRGQQAAAEKLREMTA